MGLFSVCGARYKTRPGLTYHYNHSHKEQRSAMQSGGNAGTQGMPPGYPGAHDDDNALSSYHHDDSNGPHLGSGYPGGGGSSGPGSVGGGSSLTPPSTPGGGGESLDGMQGAKTNIK